MWNNEEKDIVFTSVVASGETGAEIIARWESDLPIKRYKICDTARRRLPLVKAVSAPGRDIKVAVIKGEYFPNDARTTDHIRAAAKKLGLKIPGPELAWLLGEQLGGAARHMGIDEIVVMHNPFRDLGQYTVYLSVSYSISVKLQTQNDFWRHVWTNHHRYKIGFAFLAE